MATPTRDKRRPRSAASQQPAAADVPRGVRIRRWVVAFAAAWAHITLMYSVPVAYSFTLAIALLAIPAVITLWKRPASRARWWRWLVLWFVFATTVPAYAIVTLACGETWLLHRSWCLESARTSDDKPTGPRKLRRSRR